MKSLPKLLSFACITYTSVILSANATHLAHEHGAIGGLPGSTLPTPAVQAPVVRAPVIQAPVVRAPVIKAPVVRAPAIQTPVVRAPAIQAPVVRAPVIQTPIVRAPAIQAPVVRAPVIKAPVVRAPVIQAPVVRAPVIKAPVVQAPVIKAPVVRAPVIQTPVVRAPAIQAPVVRAPVIKAPVVQAPVIKAPVVRAPVLTVPTIKSPIVSVPSISSPTISTPVVKAPVISAPALTSRNGVIIEDSLSPAQPTLATTIKSSTVIDSPALQAQPPVRVAMTQPNTPTYSAMVKPTSSTIASNNAPSNASVLIEDTLSSSKPTLATVIKSPDAFNAPSALTPNTSLSAPTVRAPMRVAMAQPQSPSYSAVKRSTPPLMANKGISSTATSFADTYAGVQFTIDELDLGSAASNNPFDLNQAGLHLGVSPTDWFSLELRYGTGVGGAHEEGDDTYKIDNTSGAYGLWSIPLSKYLNSPVPIKPYIATGLTRIKLDSSAADKDLNDLSYSGFSYGAGLSYDALDNVSASIEYMNYVDKDTFSADGVNFKLSYKF